MRFVARQPIFDRTQNVFGYELLARPGSENIFSGTDFDAASVTVIDDGLHVFGLDRLLGGKMAFINVTRRVLNEGLLHLLPPSRTVVEVLETVAAEEDVLTACRALKQAGYIIALDDFVLRPDLEPLIALADIIKIDFLQTDADERERLCARFAGKVQLLAEKVETRAAYDEARKLNFDYFQGYFFCKPEMITARALPASKINRLRFLKEVNRTELDLAAVEVLIKQEAALSISLLRFLNSGYFTWKTQITSIRHALTLLGERQLRSWASLTTLKSLVDEKPPELLVTSMARARFFELVAPTAGFAGQEFDLFMLGILSVLDALLDAPMQDLLSGFPISAEVRDTLLTHQGKMGALFDLMMAHERANWDEVQTLTVAMGLDPAKVWECYVQSITWADTVLGELGPSRA